MLSTSAMVGTSAARRRARSAIILGEGASVFTAAYFQVSKTTQSAHGWRMTRSRSLVTFRLFLQAVREGRIAWARINYVSERINFVWANGLIICVGERFCVGEHG